MHPAALKHGLREELRRHLADVLRERTLPTPSDLLFPDRASNSPRAHANDDYAEILRRQIQEREEERARRYREEEPNGVLVAGSAGRSNAMSKEEQRQVLMDQAREARARREAEERTRREEEARADLKLLKELQELQLLQQRNGNHPPYPSQPTSAPPLSVASTTPSNLQTEQEEDDDRKMERILEQMQLLTRQLDQLQSKRPPRPLPVVDKYFVFGGPSSSAAGGGDLQASRDDIPDSPSSMSSSENESDDDAHGAAEAALFALRRAASASSGDEWGEPQSREENSEESSPSNKLPSPAHAAQNKPDLNINSFLEADAPSDVLMAIAQSMKDQQPMDASSSSQDGSLVFKETS